jgi:hypothetical protein
MRAIGKVMWIVVCAGALIGLAGQVTSAAAQPLAWSVQASPVDSPPPSANQLVVFNFATGLTEFQFAIPSGVRTGSGVLTPDGRYFLLPTNVGIGRFTTNPPAFDRLLAAGVNVAAFVVEPSGTRLHATGAFGHAVLDWESGATLSTACCTQPSIVFSPDGQTSVYLETIDESGAEFTRITVYSEPAHTARWSTDLPGASGPPAAVNDTDLALPLSTPLLRPGSRLYILRLSDGALRRMLFRAPAGMAWHGSELLMSESSLNLEQRLTAYDPDTDTERIVVSTSLAGLRPGRVTIGTDARAYWFLVSGMMGGPYSTYQSIVDLASGTLVRQPGIFASGLHTAPAIEVAPLCQFVVPASAAAPPAGGNVSIPVVPGPGCRSWTAPAGLNPGPHTGAATVLIPAGPNTTAGVRTFNVSVAGQRVSIEQPAALPAPPTLTIEHLRSNRLLLNWAPQAGGGVTSWVIRGAVAGGAVTDLVSVEPSQRAWPSPPLPPGSYEVEVVAVNAAGRSAPSNRVRFSLNVSERPAPPIDLAAAVVGDRISLSWAASPQGPAPSGYVVEGADASGVNFVAVASTTMPSLIIPDAPIGTWHVRVRAHTAGGTSEPSAPVILTTAACTTPPAAPASVWTVRTALTTTLRWSPPAGHAVRDYIVDVGTALGVADLGQFVVAGEIQEFSGVALSSPVTAIVQVRARNACGISLPSSPVAVPGY